MELTGKNTNKIPAEISSNSEHLIKIKSTVPASENGSSSFAGSAKYRRRWLSRSAA